ncbi:MAG: alpha/beta fold hydrolase [Polyangiaceae bacterium]|nr:alpha/beta fold hydrolase [Polyangiaceae bacterium]
MLTAGGTVMRLYDGIALALAATFVGGCDGSNETTATGGSGGSGGSGVGGTGATGGGGAGNFEVQVAWEKCPLDSTKTTGTDAECATVKVPSTWEDPAGPTIEIFLKRWPVVDTPSDHHVWLIQGGPGSSSVEWERRVKQMSGSFPGAQFYLQDPRGTGRSTRLGCPIQEDLGSEEGLEISLNEWPDCLEVVNSQVTLSHFTTTETAKDLGEVMKVLSGTAAKRTLLGQSYGTYLLQRWLHFYPGFATATILDSLANPGNTFTFYSERTDEVGHDYLTLCGQDPTCAARFTLPPEKAIDAAFSNAFDMNGCPGLVAAGIDRAALALDLFTLMVFAEYRSVIIPVVHRLERCNATDVDALVQFHSAFVADPLPSLEEKYFGNVLYYNIVFGEMWEASPPTPEQHLTDLSQLEFGFLDVVSDKLWQTWPKYSEPLAAVYPETTDALLLLNGTLDPQTPLSNAIGAKDHYKAEHQTFVTVPYASHGAIGGEPWSQPSPPCSIQLTLGFIDDPSAPIQDDCFSLVDTPSFEPDAATSQLFFGTTDPWGDGAPPPPAPTKESLADARQKLRNKLLVRRAPGLSAGR